jgi:hypothetical protein
MTADTEDDVSKCKCKSHGHVKATADDGLLPSAS